MGCWQSRMAFHLGIGLHSTYQLLRCI